VLAGADFVPQRSSYDARRTDLDVQNPPRVAARS
jgi:hypothetical protein